VHSTHADPRPNREEITGESSTSRVRSQIRCIRKLHAFPVEAPEFEFSTTSNSVTALLTQWCLHSVKKAWSELRASYLCC
jgi:hypothetical protein